MGSAECDSSIGNLLLLQISDRIFAFRYRQIFRVSLKFALTQHCSPRHRSGGSIFKSASAPGPAQREQPVGSTV